MPRSPRFDQVNAFVAAKQRLSGGQHTDLLQVVRNVVALHGTAPTSPYLSLRARLAGFARRYLDEALHAQRSLVRFLCMRRTLHLVAADELSWFAAAYQQRHNRDAERTSLMVIRETGLAAPGEAEQLLATVQDQVVAEVARRGQATSQEIATAVPRLQAKMAYAEGKPYAGTFSLATAVIRGLCISGRLVRARATGGWRSNRHQYAAMEAWLPGLDLRAVAPAEARTWLVFRYLTAFGPATFDDVQWWTGFTKGETRAALGQLADRVSEISLAGQEAPYLLANGDAERLRETPPLPETEVALLGSLDPYLMGYRDRQRFLSGEHHDKVFDRSGNAVHTVFAGGRVVGIWSQRKDGSVATSTFEEVSGAVKDTIAGAAAELEQFLDGEPVTPRFRTKHERALADS